MIGNREAHLHGTGGNMFGKLSQSQTPDRFVLAALDTNHTHTIFCGDFKSHIVKVTDGNSSLLATSEPTQVEFASGKFCRLRVAPLVDAGLVFCSLICINYMIAG